MPTIQLIIFDMAGTTVDEDNIVYKTVHRAVERAGFEVPLETVLLIAAGKEKLQAIKDVLAEAIGNTATEETALAVHLDFTHLLETAYSEHTARPMPGAEFVFEKLQERGIFVVLNTGYRRPVADHLLRQLGWLDHPNIDLVVTADDVEQGRPHPDMIFKAMDELDILDPKSVVKIGDSIVDIEEGLNAGCGIVAGITTGAQTAEQLKTAAPTHIFNALVVSYNDTSIDLVESKKRKCFLGSGSNLNL